MTGEQTSPTVYDNVHNLRQVLMPTTPCTIRLDDELKKALEQEAALEDRPAAQLAARAIRTMLEAKEAKRQTIDAALLEAGKGAFISDEAMNAWIDSWDSAAELPMPQADLPSTDR